VTGPVAPLEAAPWAVLAPVPPGGSVLWVGTAREERIAQLSLIFDRVSKFDPTNEGNGPEPWKTLAVPEASADLAVLPGVLGAVNRWAPGTRPREAWKLLLRATHARLKPGGHVFLAAENRWALSRAPTQGGGRPSVSASLRAYRRLLVRAGFSGIRMWCAFPNWDDAKFLVECRPRVFDHFLATIGSRSLRIERRALRNLLNSAGALKYTARWYWILGRRDTIAT
jgi:hypothetical protein